MNALSRNLVAEVVMRSAGDEQTSLTRDGKCVIGGVWRHKYGSMLIEVEGGDVFVDGQRVEPHVQ